MIEKRKLGEDGFGAVTLSKDPECHELIGLKSFHRNTSAEVDNATESLTKEIDMLVNLVDPCVLDIVGYSHQTRLFQLESGRRLRRMSH
jgi:hypothetical protein